MKPNGTLARAHDEGLTLDQQNAVHLTAAGATDTEAAEKLNAGFERNRRGKMQ